MNRDMNPTNCSREGMVDVDLLSGPFFYGPLCVDDLFGAEEIR